MSETQTVAAPKLLADFLTEKEVLAEFGFGDRTLRRREAEGLPVVVLGTKRLYPREEVMTWLLAQVRGKPEAPRGRGRPAGKKAA